MVIEVTQNGKSYYMHAAWADGEDGAGFSLEEHEDTSFAGTYVDTDPDECENPARYTWVLVGEKEEEDTETDFDEQISDLFDQAEDLHAKAIVTGEDVEKTQGSADDGIGHPNLLKETNQGLNGWSASEGIELSEYKDTVYTNQIGRAHV